MLRLGLRFIASVSAISTTNAVRIVPAMVTVAGAISVVASAAQAQTTPPPILHPCLTSAEAKQFDFWIGTWDVTPWKVPAATAKVIGTNVIQPILEHCVLLENWTSARGGQGKSFNYYDTNLGKWRQIWMADSGGPLDYTGEFSDGAMRFVGWNKDAKGNRLEQKLTFFAISADTVRQLFEQSADGGKTWTATFDGRYVRRR